MSSVAKCLIVTPSVNGLEDSKLTVGRHLEVNCQLDEAVAFDFAKAQIKSSEVLTFKLFKTVQIDDKSFKLDITFYKTGTIDFANYILTDGNSEIAMHTAPVTFESVIVPPTDGKPTQPFGPIFPLHLPIPSLYFWILLSIVVLSSIQLFFSFKKRSYYKKLRESLKKYQSPTDPHTQFYRTLRSLEKTHYPLAEVEQCFKLYVLRAYHLPIFELTHEKIIKYFKYMSPAQKNTRLQLQKILTDFEEFNKKNNPLSIEEKNDFIKKLYRFVEQNKGESL